MSVISAAKETQSGGISFRVVATTPFTDQRPGTSGLRKKVPAFQVPHYAENYIQALLNLEGGAAGSTLVVGGDGRYYNDVVTQLILKMAVANGVSRIIVGQNGILSTPAASHLIRLHKAKGGFVLSASHNPGGPDGDYGLKYNVANGGPAPDRMIEEIYANTQALTTYSIATIDDIDLSVIGEKTYGNTVVSIIDPVTDYAALMEKLFDFAAIRAMISGGFRLAFDAMHAVTGPYAVEILEKRLGAPSGTVMNRVPQPDFAGGHPDPGVRYSAELFKLAFGPDAPDMACASDGDGDRGLILGPGQMVTPADSLAVLAANASHVPGYKAPLKGIARSMPTAPSADRVAAKLGVPLHETGVGYKFFGSLMDAGMTTLCGEENGGLGSDHIREKDGLWVALFWLNVLAARGKGINALLKEHWAEFGRDYFCRHDYEIEDGRGAEAAFGRLRDRLPSVIGKTYAGLTVVRADEFSYKDPVDGWLSTKLGLRIFYEGGMRTVLRFAGTVTSGATLRLYYDRHETDATKQMLNPEEALAQVIAASRELIGVSEIPELPMPTAISL